VLAKVGESIPFIGVAIAQVGFGGPSFEAEVALVGFGVAGVGEGFAFGEYLDALVARVPRLARLCTAVTVWSHATDRRLTTRLSGQRRPG
jgi:hypothetical protein